MAGEGEAGDMLYGKPDRKVFQSFKCGEIKATLYYYQFSTREDLTARLGTIKAVLWGEPGPTTLHPELVLDIENVLIVVSSRQPGFFASIISHRVEFPDLSDAAVDSRMKRLRCGSARSASPELCAALQDFERGTLPASVNADVLVIGRSSEISEESEASRALFEVLYVGQDPDAGSVASFGPITPDNEDERKQILSQLEAQKEGKVAESAAPLMAFVREAFAKTRARARSSEGRSFAFIGLGNRVYVRSSGRKLILTTDLMQSGKKRPYVVAEFQMREPNAVSEK